MRICIYNKYIDYIYIYTYIIIYHHFNLSIYPVEILNDQARCHLGRDLVISPTAGGHNLNQQLHAALSKICPQHSHGNAMGNAIEKNTESLGFV